MARLPFYASVAATFPRPPIDLASPEYNGPVVIGEQGAELYARFALLYRQTMERS